MLIAPAASATPADVGGNDQKTICHVTNSTENPYVVITIDVAAWDNAHIRHVNNNGDADVEGPCPEPPTGDLSGT